MIFDEQRLEFNTAWTAPVPFFRKLAELLPEHCKMTIRYADEDVGNNCGQFLKNGKHLIFQAPSEPMKFAIEVWGWKEDDFDFEGGE